MSNVQSQTSWIRDPGNAQPIWSVLMTATSSDVFILGGARTPMTEYVGALKDLSACELGTIASRAALDRTGVKPDCVDHVVFGSVLQTGGSSIYDTRYIALKSGVPTEA